MCGTYFDIIFSPKTCLKQERELFNEMYDNFVRFPSMPLPMHSIASEFGNQLVQESSHGGRASRARIHIKLLSEPARLVSATSQSTQSAY